MAIESFIALTAFLFGMLLYSTPIGNSFGIVSILSGVDRSSLDLLKGAGFSGELRDPVKLCISPKHVSDDSDPASAHQFKYTVSRDLHTKAVTSRIKRHKKYE